MLDSVISQRATLLAVGLGVTVLAGCCPKRFALPSDPVLVGVSVNDAEALGDALSRRLREYAQKTQSMAYTTRMEHYGPRGVIKGKVDVLGKRPGQFRFEALSPSDDTLGLLVSDGKRFMSHERGRPICYVGAACAANISRLLPLPFEGPALFDLLVGGAPMLENAVATGRWNDCEGTYELVLSRGDTRQVIWLRPDVFAPVRMQVTSAGNELFRIEYSEFEPLDGALQAQTMRYISAVREVDLTMTIRDAERNGLGDSPQLFRVNCPQGTQRRELQCP